MREWLNRYGVLLVCAVALGAGLAFWRYGGSRAAPPDESVKAFYVDEETGEETVRPMTEVPPLMGKGGKATVVVAKKYTCDGGRTSKVGYLMKYTPDAKAELEAVYKGGKNPAMMKVNVREHTLVRLPESGAAWVSAQSGEGARVMENGGCGAGERKVGVEAK